MSQDSLIRIHSCWSLAEAEIVRMRLASEGIPSCFENASVVLWCWYYANATGGVKLFVRRSDADEARRILSTADHLFRDDASSWTCSRCGQTVDETWRVCWSCSTPIDGGELPAPAAEEPPAGFDDRAPGINPAASIPLAVMIVALLTIFCGASLATVVLSLVIVLLTLFVSGHKIGGCHQRPPLGVHNVDGHMPKEIAGEDNDSCDPAAWAGDETARRAWQAAVFGCLAFPPLFFSIYSIWLLLGRLRKETSLSRIGRRRIRAAWAVNAITMPLSIGMLSVVFIDAYRDFLWHPTVLLDSWWDLLM